MPRNPTPTIQQVMEQASPFFRFPGDKFEFLISLGYSEQDILDAGYSSDDW
jgi:hypothetical protein